MIRLTTYQLLHSLISISLTHHKHHERVPSTDVFYLWALIIPGRHMNFSIFVAMYLARKAREARDDSLICGGHFITRLARSYSLLTREITRRMIRYEMQMMSQKLLEMMRVILH